VRLERAFRTGETTSGTLQGLGDGSGAAGTLSGAYGFPVDDGVVAGVPDVSWNGAAEVGCCGGNGVDSTPPAVGSL
jgi:hypothetical protein